jgi:hypothetical protein
LSELEAELDDADAFAAAATGAEGRLLESLAFAGAPELLAGVEEPGAAGGVVT